jgi:mycofactocin precursor
MDDDTTTTGHDAPAAPLAPASPTVAAAGEAVDDGLLLDELLVEEISIDGMCGVY